MKTENLFHILGVGKGECIIDHYTSLIMLLNKKKNV